MYNYSLIKKSLVYTENILSFSYKSYLQRMDFTLNTEKCIMELIKLKNMMVSRDVCS